MNFNVDVPGRHLEYQDQPTAALKRWSLSSLVGILWRRRWIIVLAVLAALVLSTLYVLTTPPVFTATASLVTDTKRSPPSPTESTPDGLVDMAVVDSQVEAIRSEKIALAAVDRLRLWDDPEFAGGGPGRLTGTLIALGLAEPKPHATEEVKRREAVAVFRRGLKITRLGRSYVTELSFTSLDPAKAAEIANATAEAYIEDQLGAKIEVAQRASEWMQGRIMNLRQQSTDALQAVEDFKSRNNIIADASGRLASERELDELSTALARARADTAQAEARLDRIQTVLAHAGADPTGLTDATVADTLSNPVILRLRQQYLDAARQEADWSARFGTEHVAAANFRSEMGSLRKSIESEVRRIAETYKSDLEIARGRENSVSERVSQVFQLTSSVRQDQARLRELEAAAQTYKAIYETFLNRFTQAAQQQSFPVTEARLLSRASPPLAKSAPKTSVTLMLGLLAGGALGVVGAFGREHFDRVVRRPRQLERETGLRALGLLPDGKGRRWLPFRRGRSRGSAPVLLVGGRRWPGATETLRAVRVAVDQRSRLAGGLVVGVASALPGEGKTTVAYNLAVLTAESRRRTLLIDADLRTGSLLALNDAKDRSRSLAQSLGATGGVSLAELLSGTATLADSVVKNDRGFDLLASASAERSLDGSDLLGSHAMTDLLVKARQLYDYVVIDLPAMLDCVDALAVAGAVDAFVLVAEYGRTSLDDVDRALTSADKVADKLVGFVLNKAKAAGIGHR